MGQKQIVTRTQIAKMAGTDVTHFLNQRARFKAKSYGGQPPDLVDIAAVSHPRLSDHHG